jgi:hypothetical protein
MTPPHVPPPALAPAPLGTPSRALSPGALREIAKGDTGFAAEDEVETGITLTHLPTHAVGLNTPGTADPGEHDRKKLATHTRMRDSTAAFVVLNTSRESMAEGDSLKQTRVRRQHTAH